MIIIENVTINNKDYVKTYSDNGCMIECESVLYAEAIDPVGVNRKYTETDKTITEALRL